MAKIRDLGINVIPATMRPPEIGHGGGHGWAAACPDPSGKADSANCPPPPPMCMGESQKPPTCEGTSGKPPGGGGGGKGKDGLTPEDTAQLYQQMRERIEARF